jgi:filamentous hemagglutinin family protein
MFSPLVTLAAPTGGQVSSGNASISQSGVITTINQSSQHANINWNSFNVGENETVNFVQPNSQSSTLNQIHDANPSSILGAINANGRVFLSNSNGFIFGANSLINVGALFATTSEIDKITDTNLKLSAGGQGSISNQGNINTQSGGYIGFFAPNIENTGILNSPEGSITLSNASSGTLYLPNSAGIGFTIDSLDSLNPMGIENTGHIKASGGQVLLSSAAVDTTLRNAINNQGIIDVSAIQQNGGDIRILASQGSINQADLLNADSVINGNGGDIIMIADKDMIHSGISSARGGNVSGNGGFIETSGFSSLELNALIDTRALNGEWGTWLIDPTTLDIGDAAGTDITSANIIAALSTNSSVEYQADTSINILGGIDTNDAVGTLILTTPTLNINSDINTDSLNLNSTNIIINSNTNLTASNTLDINGILTAASGTLRLTATDLNINANLNTSSLDLNSTNINLNLNADLTASGEMIFKDDTNLFLNGDSTLTISGIGSGALSLNGAKIAGANADDSLTLTTKNGKIDLRRMEMVYDTRLNEFIINRETIDATSANNENITMSGDIFANTFSVNNTTDNKDQNINLAADTNISTIDTNFTNTNINGSNSTLVLNSTNSMTLHKVDGIAALTTTTPSLTLTDDISTQGDGINLTSAGNTGIINLNKTGELVSLTTRNTGNLTLGSDILATSGNTDLKLIATDGAIEIKAITGVTDFTIQNSSSLTSLKGDINIEGNFLTDTSSVNLIGDRSITAAGNIDIKNTEFTTSNTTATTTITAETAGKSVKLGDFTTGSLIVNSTALHLNGTIATSKETENSLNLSNSGAISLESDTTLNGNLYLGALGSEVAIDSLSGSTLKSLEINYDNQELNLGQIGATTPLQSFALNGSGTLKLASTSTFSIFTSGNTGISFLGNEQGNLTLNLLDDLIIDTSGNSGSGGDINLSGLNINGEFAVNLTAGSGNISLGKIGDTAAVTSITAVNTGNIELHGNINNLANAFDFSNASAVILNDNITFGSSELYLTSLLFGDASINGNYDLTIFSSALTFDEIGQNIALQNLTINTLDQPLMITNDVNTAGNISIDGGNLGLTGNLVSTGGEITINSLTGMSMSAESKLSATDGGITLTATEGDINIASIDALNNVSITATTGHIYNAINDYTSNTSTSTNITATTISLTSGGNIGASVDSPIVINAGKEGSLELTAGGKIHIANLENSATSSNKDIFDNSSLTTSANADILSQLKPTTDNQTQFTKLEVSNPIWQLDQLGHEFDSSNSSPRIYYSKKGWRLGNPKQ